MMYLTLRGRTLGCIFAMISLMLLLAACSGSVGNSDSAAFVVDAGPDRTAVLGEALALDAVVTENGQPPQGNLTYSWSKVSGPGEADFTASDARATSVTFTEAGSYLLNLQVKRDGSVASDTLKVTVNLPPPLVVDAGPDRTAVLGEALALDAVVTENGQPPQGDLTYSWSKVSGPGEANFTATDAKATSVTFTEAGSYLLNLQVKRDGSVASDTLKVTVNLPPVLVVDAGPDRTAVLGETLALDAVVTENGQPPQGDLTYSWSKVSGPGEADFTASDANATSVTFTEAGSYLLDLQANSDFAAADDSLEITVNIKAAGGSGLSVRPSNAAECVAPPTPPIPPSILLSDPFPNLPNLSSPVAMYMAPGDDSYWYVVQQTGQVVRFENSAAANSVSTFIDIDDARLVNDGEKGLLDIAFHPNFADNGYVYLCYTHEDNATQELVSRISRFSLAAASQTLDPDSELIILTISEPYETHNVEQIMFGPDGYLYIATGDGGSSGDPKGNGQNADTLLGAILRIDVGNGSSGVYAIPADNPFADGGGRPEIFAYGFRNPWRSSFDTATGKLWVADVGLDRYEEIDIVVKGGNYGWNTMEGVHCFKPSDCDPTGLELPVWEYDHTQGFSVTGGFVYRGSAVGFLQGQYLYGDFISGRIWGLEQTGPEQYASTELLDSSLNIVAFAEDHQGELYVVNIGGSIHKIVENGDSQSSQLPAQLSGWECFQSGDVTTFSPHVIPYNINALLWSDHADKGRFMAIPDGKTIDVDGEGRFDLPVGSVVGKNFRLNGRLIETRLLLHHEQPYGWKGYSYEWNGAGTDATLLEDVKEKEIDGQTWHYPSRAECDACHTAVAGFTLGPEIGQLNRSFVYPNTGIEANQLITLEHINVLTELLSDAEKSTAYYAIDDTAYSAERRARSYLHANCAHCHQPRGTGGGSMDMRMATALKDTGICNKAPQGATLGLADPRIVAPGDPDHSVLVLRMEDLGAYRMPPLATSLKDTQAIAVIREWISSLSECP